ncbi:unnamed protein product, partial [Vitis vinifera]
MASRSCANFLDLASGSLLDIPHTPRPLPRVMTRKIIVANMLPLHAQRDKVTAKWCFSLDEDALLLHLKDGFSPETEVIYVGSLKVEIDASEQEEVAQKLLEDFNCVPTFLPHDLHKKFYHGFCKQQLWPLFHYMLPMKRFHRVKLGFFLHSPFPSSEIYRTLPVRDEILRGLLNCDLIGFQTFDYARHFLSCCSRMLGLDYESKRGHIGLDYSGRTVYIKILPVGVHMGRLESVLNLHSTSAKIKEIQKQFEGKKLILGVDDMDIFKGISLKFLAVEQLLQQHPELQGKLVLVQIVNPARSTGKDVQEAKRETYLTAERINETYGSPNYEPVILIDRPVARYEKSAYYAVAECCIVNAVRDGMNLVPYKYIVCRQGTPHMDKETGMNLQLGKRCWGIVISVLSTLCSDPKNTVFIVSGRGRSSLSEWLAPCERLGIAAEHGYFMRWNESTKWESCNLAADLDWKKVVEPVMRLYTETTDGSNIEIKESALVWHHQDADPDFGSCQAKELMDHLENVLANEPAVVKRGQHIVEVKPQGVSKGLVAEKVLSTMVNDGKPPDFVMCIGDDRSDEDMFEGIFRTISSPSLSMSPEIFACTVGQKPSKAKYYLDDTTDVVRLLQGLATASNPKPRYIAQIQVSFESSI